MPQIIVICRYFFKKYIGCVLVQKKNNEVKNLTEIDFCYERWFKLTLMLWFIFYLFIYFFYFFPKSFIFFSVFFFFFNFTILYWFCHISTWIHHRYTSWTLLPPPSPYHPSGSSQCTSPKHPVSCIEPGLATRFIYDIIHVSMPFSQIIPPSPSPTESKRLFYTSVSLLLSHMHGYC